MHEGTLGNWVKKYRVDHAGEEPPLSISDRARLRELEKERRDLLGQLREVFGEGVFEVIGVYESTLRDSTLVDDRDDRAVLFGIGP